jgi:DNA polymerase eta
VVSLLAPCAPFACAGNTAAAHTPGEVISLEVGAVDTAQQHGITSAAGEGSAADRGSAKACLQRYRRASAEVMRLLAENMPGCALERASIDEAYIDISAPAVRALSAALMQHPCVVYACVRTHRYTQTYAQGVVSGWRAFDAAYQSQARELARAEASSAELGAGVAALLAAACASSCVLGSDGLCGDFQYDRLVAAGALLVQRLRDAVLARLGFTCSAGVAPNKLLAKIASALHKPAQQTIVLPRSVPQLMEVSACGGGAV